MKWDKIILMCPTYGRYDTDLVTFVDSVLCTCEDFDSIEFLFCVNKKDRGTQEWLRTKDFNGVVHNVVIENTRQPNLATYFNMMYDWVLTNRDPGAVVTMLGDDMVFKSTNWDRKILDEINKNDGIGVYYCDDDYIAKDQLCVNLFVTQKMVEATEKEFMYSKFHADMIDVVWYYVGYYSNNLYYFDDIVIRHNHNTRKKPEEWDETFQRIRPVQAIASNKQNHAAVHIYAAGIAKTLIKKGYGKRVWETI